MGAPIDFKNTPLLVNCLVATLSASDVELGLSPASYITYSSDNQGFYITLKSAYISTDVVVDTLKQTGLPRNIGFQSHRAKFW